MPVYAVRARLVVGCVLLSTLAACGGDPPTPPPLTPATSSTSSTPTSTGPVEPVLPEAATEPTEAGAKAFAEFYWEMGNYAQSSGDTRGLRHLGAATSEPCTAGVAAIDELEATDAVVRGGIYTPSVIEIRNTSTAVRAYTVTLRLAISAQVIDYPGSKKDARSGAGVGRIRMTLNFLSGSWVVAFMEKP